MGEIIYENKKTMLFLCILITYFTGSFTLDYSFAIFTGSILILTIASVTLYLEFKKSIIKLSPLSIVLLPLIISFGIGTINVADRLQQQKALYIVMHQVEAVYVFKAYVYCLVGFLFFLIGFERFYKVDKYNEAIGRKIGTVPNSLLMALYIFGILWITYLNSRLNVGSISSIFGVLPYVALLVYAFQNQNKQNNKTLPILITGTSVLFVANLPSLAKILLIYSFIPLLYYFIIKERKVSVKLVSIGAGFILFFYFFIFPYVGAARYITQDKKFDIEFSEISGLIADGNFWKINEENNQLIEASQSETILNRLSEIDATSFLVKRGEQFGYLNGEGLDYVPDAFIPRILWPDKPTVVRGHQFSAFLGTQNVSIGMTAVGELFWNFALAGVIVGMLILGLLWGVLVKISAGSNFLFLVLGLMLVLFRINSQSEWGSSFIGVVTLIVFFLMFRVFKSFISANN